MTASSANITNALANQYKYRMQDPTQPIIINK